MFETESTTVIEAPADRTGDAPTEEFDLQAVTVEGGPEYVP